MKRVPRESKGLLLLAVFLTLWIMACGGTSIGGAGVLTGEQVALTFTWGLTLDELAMIDGWITEVESYCWAHSCCQMAKYLRDSQEALMLGLHPEAEAQQVQQMMNAVNQENGKLARELYNGLKQTRGVDVFGPLGAGPLVYFAASEFFLIAMPIAYGGEFCELYCPLVKVSGPPCCCGAKEMM